MFTWSIGSFCGLRAFMKCILSMLLGNRVELLDLLVASQHAGTWVTAINWHLTASEVAYILDDSGSTILFTDPEHESVAREAAAAADHDVSVVLAGAELDALAAHPVDDPFPLDGRQVVKALSVAKMLALTPGNKLVGRAD